jgi:AraC-like DNA-binding protein
LTEQNPFGLDLRRILLSDGKKIRNFIDSDSRIAAIIQRVYEEYSDKREYYKLIIYSLITEMFAILLRDHLDIPSDSKADQKEKKAATLIVPALSLIFKEYARNITLDELAAVSNLSKYHFARVFKMKMQMTPIEYITRYRVFLTESLIALGDMSVSEAALKCGFTDVSYFYRCFKKVKGYSHRYAKKEQYRPKP